MNIKSVQKGFTLIELVIVIVLLGILAAYIVPQYQNLSTSAETGVKNGAVGAVAGAWQIYIGNNNGSFPTVTQLSAAVTTNCTATAVATGVQFAACPGGTATFTVLTFTDAACTTATAAVGNAVQCVKGFL